MQHLNQLYVLTNQINQTEGGGGYLRYLPFGFLAPQNDEKNDTYKNLLKHTNGTNMSPNGGLTPPKWRPNPPQNHSKTEFR